MVPWPRNALLASLLVLLAWPGALEAGPDPLTCSIQGTVEAGDGFTLILRSDPPGLYGDIALADPAGAYAFALVPPGSYVLAIYDPQWEIGMAGSATSRKEYDLDGVTHDLVNPFTKVLLPFRPDTDPPETEPFGVFEPGMPRMVDFPTGPVLGGDDRSNRAVTTTGGIAGWVVRPVGRIAGGLGYRPPLHEPVGGIDVTLSFTDLGVPRTRTATSFANGGFAFADVVGSPVALDVSLPGFAETLDATSLLTFLAAGDTSAHGWLDATTGDYTPYDMTAGTPVVTGPLWLWTPGAAPLTFLLPARLGGFSGRAFVEWDDPDAVFGGTDEPLAGRTIRLALASDPATTLATTMTAADGTYAFPDDYEDDPYILELVTPGAATVRRIGILAAATSSPVDFIFSGATCPDGAAPVVTCPGDIVLDCTNPTGEVVTFAASAVDDCTPDDRLVVTYVPQGPGSIFAAGTTTVTASATDFAGNVGQCSFDVRVVDGAPPTITSDLQRGVLWPASGGLVPAGATASAADACDGPVGVSTTVFSTEGDGAAPYAPDTWGTSPATLRLRAERAYPPAPGGLGRVYVVRFTATDAAGNTSIVCHSSVVPTMPTSSVLLGLRAQAALWEATCLSLSPQAATVPGLVTLLALP